jgi:predicted O-methyltransferase YrrM
MTTTRTNSKTSAKIKWLDSHTAVVDGTTFLVTEVDGEYRGKVSNGERFILVKQGDFLRRSVELYRAKAPRNIIEIGIWQGGSAVFWNLVLRPDRQLVFDLYDRSVEPLHEFVIGPKRHGQMEIRFGVDQSDRRAVSELAADLFGSEPVDIIIDDGAHSYPETRAAFETLFPLLRPGGLYVIEDWAWGHIDAPWIKEFSRDRPALTNLVVELLMMCGSRKGAIDEIIVEPRAVFVTRGSGELKSPFHIARAYYNRGASFRPLI